MLNLTPTNLKIKGKFLALLLFATSLLPLSSADTLKPNLDYSVQDQYLQHLHSIFPKLSEEELGTLWGKEYQIGVAFAKRLDLYQAITAFKRSEILIPETLFQRRAEIAYQIINAYYLGKKYSDAVDYFEDSILASTDRNFLAFHDLLIILFDSYLKTDQPERADWVLRLAKKFYPDMASKLELTSAISQADLVQMQKLSDTKETNLKIARLEEKAKKAGNDILLTSNLKTYNDSYTPEDEMALFHLKDLSLCQTATGKIAKDYLQSRKSPLLAGALNAFLPGAGYLYLGQHQSAFTSLCLNALFTASSAYFFKNHNLPAGILFASFEAGWYFGGILGAKENATYYNEHVYRNHAHWQMRDHKLFPVLMLKHGF